MKAGQEGTQVNLCEVVYIFKYLFALANLQFCRANVQFYGSTLTMHALY